MALWSFPIGSNAEAIQNSPTLYVRAQRKFDDRLPIENSIRSEHALWAVSSDISGQFDVGQSGGRPHGTTREAGYDVGCSRSRPCGRSRTINFSGSIELPTEWDHLVIFDDQLLGLCSRKIAQQRTYDKKPLGVAVCYRCGHMLWSSVDGTNTFLVSKPSGMSEEEAPASAYLRAVPNCVAGFVYTERGKLTKDTVNSIAITAHTHTHTQ